MDFFQVLWKRGGFKFFSLRGDDNMAKFDEVLHEILRSVDGAIGCAVVDLNSGLLLASAHNVPHFTSSYLEAVAAAAVDMIRGKTVRAVESLLSTQRGVPVQRSIKEVQMTTDKTYHFMATLKNKPDCLLVLITTHDANLGMGWAAVRNSMTKIEPMCP